MAKGSRLRPVLDGDRERFGPGRSRRAALGAVVRAAADDQLLGDSVLGQRGAFENRPHAPVADHGDASRVLVEVAEPMRDEKHDPAVRGELVDLSEQLVGFLVGQRGIRLVEQEDLRVARDRAGDLGALLGGERAVGELRVGEAVDAERLHHLRVRRAELRAPDAAVPSRPTSTFSATVRLGKSCGS